MWTDESMNEAAACHQIERDKLATLYEIGCKYDMGESEMRRLCDVAGLRFEQLEEFNGVPA